MLPSRAGLFWNMQLAICLQGFLAGMAGVVAAFFTREGLLLRLSGMQLIDVEGGLPSRGQLALRSILSALVCLPLVLAQAGRTQDRGLTTLVCEVIALTVFALIVLGTILAIRNPQHGPLERVTATRIVRR